MTTAWLISSGSYSDYQVDWICTSKEVADGVVAAFPGAYQAEEVELIDKVPPRVTVFSMWWELSRDVGDPERERGPSEGVRVQPGESYPYAMNVWADYQRDRIRVSVTGDDQERVRKAMADMRGQILAELAEGDWYDVLDHHCGPRL